IYVDVEGLDILEKSMPGVIVQNHQSSMDLMPLGATYPFNCGILAKSSLKWYPFLGQFSTLFFLCFVWFFFRDFGKLSIGVADPPILCRSPVLAGQTIFVNRSKHEESIKAMDMAAQEMKRKKVMLLFC